MDIIKFKCDTVSDEDWNKLQNLKMYIDSNGDFIFNETSDNFVYYLFRKNRIICEINNVRKTAQVFYYSAVYKIIAVRLYE